MPGVNVGQAAGARLTAAATSWEFGYGPGTTTPDAWQPYRTWAAVHLRALRERRTREISGGSTAPG